MKKIQDDWKKIGHVPRKNSDKIWNEFKSACNHYFDKLLTPPPSSFEQPGATPNGKMTRCGQRSLIPHAFASS
jgi:hypothetical protein